jgi:hypothetical protein
MARNNLSVTMVYKPTKNQKIRQISFTENYEQTTENYSTNNYAGINKGEGQGEGENLKSSYQSK